MRRWILLCFLLTACTSGGTAEPTPAAPTTTATATPPATPRPTTASSQPRSTAIPTYARHGPGTWRYAAGDGPVFGTSGRLLRYRVAVETGVPVGVAAFTAAVDGTLGDPRSWIAGKDVRLQRVGKDGPSDFTVRLASPGTTQDLCAAAGLDIFWRGEPYTSCFDNRDAVLNLNRWFHGVPHYGAPLTVYRQYAINHEVGHALGHGHELCPAKGRPAPVMQQQTFDLQGCTANAWPYLHGRRYAGPPGRIVPPG